MVSTYYENKMVNNNLTVKNSLCPSCKNEYDYLTFIAGTGQNVSHIWDNKTVNITDDKNIGSNDCLCTGSIEIAIFSASSVIMVVIISILIYLLVTKLKKQHMLRKKREIWATLYTTYPKKYTVFLSFCSEDITFVLNRVYPKLNEGLQKILGTNYRCVAMGDTDFRPGLLIANETIRCIDESSVVVFIVSDAFCKKKWCRYEILTASCSHKPIVLMIMGQVDFKLMPKILLRHYETYTRVHWATENGKLTMNQGWNELCENIVRLVGTSAIP